MQVRFTAFQFLNSQYVPFPLAMLNSQGPEL